MSIEHIPSAIVTATLLLRLSSPRGSPLPARAHPNQSARRRRTNAGRRARPCHHRRPHPSSRVIALATKGISHEYRFGPNVFGRN